MLAVVGVGIARGHLTERGKKLIETADVVYGSRKALSLVDEIAGSKSVIIESFSRKTYEEIEEEAKNRNVVVLSTGDPMVSGMGTKLNADVVEPGISSVLVALSRLRTDLCDVVVVKCHARDCLSEIIRFLDFRPVLSLITRDFDFKELSGEISKKLKKFGNGEVRAVVLEELCGNERIFEVESLEKLENFSLSSSNAILYLEIKNTKSATSAERLNNLD